MAFKKASPGRRWHLCMQLSWSCGAHHNEPIEAEVPRLWPHRDGNQGAFVGAPERTQDCGLWIAGPKDTALKPKPPG